MNAFRVTLNTNKGLYGTTALFKPGLNVIRAENTSGKSSLINGILYALGMEILVGKKGIEATKPVLRKTGDYNGETFNVIESFVELEVVNMSDEMITIRRYVCGGKSPSLIEVVFGSVITNSHGSKYQTKAFFVGLEGAAQREQGFHYFLSDFLDLKLPYVKRFTGGDVPLYIECIAPLMFIEQIRGWSGIQATLPQSYGIRKVANLAMEYVLDLDVIENDKRRIQISEEACQIRNDWRSIRDSMVFIASQVGGTLTNCNTTPIVTLPDEPWISISTSKEDATSLDDLLILKRSLIENYGKGMSEHIGNEELEAKLEKQENNLLIIQAELSQIRTDIGFEEEELKKLNERLEFIKTDIQRNKDIKRLREFGVENGLLVSQGQCPTCNQNIQDSLIPTDDKVMGIDENILFLKSEMEAVELLSSVGKERISRMQSYQSKKSREISNLRINIRDLRSDLLVSEDLSRTTIREQIQLEEEIKHLEQLRDEFDEKIDRLKSTAKSWQINRSKYSELPINYFSETDKIKLNLLSNYFKENVRQFGYRSSEAYRLQISEDNYRPICDDFEVAYGASASDNIRIIWAYTLALLQVSSEKNGNHWGVLIYDEPEQQKMSDTSSDALYEVVARMPQTNLQVIVATSASKDITNNRLANLPHHLLEFGEKVFRPIE